MKTDSWIGSVVWGRIGGAALLITAFVLQGLGMDFSADDQQHAFGAIQTILAGIGGVLVMVSKIREKNKEKKSIGQSGHIRIALMLAILLAMSSGVFLFGGCQGQSATQQITAQTDDPVKIADALYYDAMGIYKDTAETYLRYRSLVAADHPDINREIVTGLNSMKALLDDWRALQGLAKMAAIEHNSEEFHGLRRQIIFDLAEYIDEGR